MISVRGRKDSLIRSLNWQYAAYQGKIDWLGYPNCYLELQFIFHSIKTYRKLATTYNTRWSLFFGVIPSFYLVVLSSLWIPLDWLVLRKLPHRDRHISQQIDHVNQTMMRLLSRELNAEAIIWREGKKKLCRWLIQFRNTRFHRSA